MSNFVQNSQKSSKLTIFDCFGQKMTVFQTAIMDILPILPILGIVWL